MDLTSYVIGFLWGIALCCIVYKVYKIYKNKQIINMLLSSISDDEMKALFNLMDEIETEETEDGDDE